MLQGPIYKDKQGVLFTLNHHGDLFFSPLSSISHQSAPSVLRCSSLHLTNAKEAELRNLCHSWLWSKALQSLVRVTGTIPIHGKLSRRFLEVKQKNTFCLPEISLYVKAFHSMLETPTLVEEPRAGETSAFTLCPEQPNTRSWFFSLFSAMKQRFQYTRVKIPPSFRRRPDKPSPGLLSAGPP